MGLFTDDKGRPELVVHPDILLGRATFRPVDDEPEPEETPKQRARRELKKRMTEERLAKQKTGDTDPEKS
ncbi:hypothetical protein [Rhodococcus koreensis]|uniref:Uncharacterized protein n=1 Tax=Rhodococcus koreensis TaxID=99653 RepID=A0A1H5F1Z8_9NOCA|nr:hypothetical protein [Rhodococcus koreensis]SED97382.1 hypothetical protein SAMN04490239_9466 [Rhodococcus koreensis]